MKCPKCGYWNRDSFPKCFRCGEELPRADAGQTRAKPEMPKDAAPKTYIQINEEGQATSAVDSRDQLAREMEDLAARKRRGEAEHRRLRENSATQGFAPSARIAQTMTGRRTFPLPQNTSYIRNEDAIEGDVRPDAIPVTSQRVIGYDEEARPEPGMAYWEEASSRRRGKQIKIYRYGFLRRFGKIIAAVLIIAALGTAGYEYLYKPYMEQMEKEAEKNIPKITPSVLDERNAHIFQLPGEDGQVYWITELKTSYPVVDGYATFEVNDYKWYEHLENITEEKITATITPYLRTAAGEQKRMPQIPFEVTIPESTLELVTPSTSYTQTYRQLYEIQVRVTIGSTVTVNGEDYTPLVNAEGLLTFQAQIDPIGENPFVITTRAEYCREKTETIIIYRPEQKIRLDLAADIATRYSSQTMKITGTTLTWATITVESPYQNLDTTELATRGTFSFEAVFNKIGNNTIIIRASAPGYDPSVVEHDVYYVPIADVYTRKAWSMKDQYTDYLNNSDKRIANTQIYQCDGVITQIISKNPQMSVMELSDGSGRTLLFTNNTYDTWQEKSLYRIFGDAYGLYDGAPWLNARYSYIQKPKEEAAK